MKFTNQFSVLLQTFFSQRLTNEMNASVHTKASYSYTFQQLLAYAKKKLKKTASQLKLEDLDYKFICGFLSFLVTERGLKPQSLNVRITAIKSFFHYIEPHMPEYSDLISKVLSIKGKKPNSQLMDYLDDKEVVALLKAPNQQTWLGSRDHCLIAVAIQTGLRLSELVSLRWRDISLSEHAYVYCLGKGRKERNTMVGEQVSKILHAWSKKVSSSPSDIVFPTIEGNQMSSDTVQYLVKKYITIAAKSSPSLKNKKISPHKLRHTAAMRLLNGGAGLAGIALWLGHESFKTTYKYLNASVELKEKIMESVSPLKTKTSRFHPEEKLRNFLKKICSLNKEGKSN
ncbi:MAG: tyrosine-type recombinase/integrase [Parachlamydiaceae bacterium]|nr:tyrosine-type recombinase/integrase [Parachlamydiaceae bacterium]